MVIVRALGYSQDIYSALGGARIYGEASVNINCEKTCKCKYNSVGTENSENDSLILIWGEEKIKDLKL